MTDEQQAQRRAVRVPDQGGWVAKRDHREFSFAALRPESRAKLIAAAFVGPIAWLIAFLVAILLQP